MIEIKACSATDFHDIYAVCNDAARAYRGVIPADQWKEPYMPESELRHEIAAGVRFFGAFDNDLVGVMGIQDVCDVSLIRHAYIRNSQQRTGIGGALLAHLRTLTRRPVLVGTWRAATWAVAFYERHGFKLLEGSQRETLLRRYWTVSERQIEESVVMRLHESV